MLLLRIISRYHRCLMDKVMELLTKKGNERWKVATHEDILLLKLSVGMSYYQEEQEIYLLYGRIRC